MCITKINPSHKYKDSQLNRNYQCPIAAPDGVGTKTAPGQGKKPKPSWQDLQAYAEKRAHEAGIEGPRYFIAQDGTKSAQVPQLAPARIFQARADAVSILYSDWNGRPYPNPAGIDAPYFTRYRLAPWSETPTMKYWQPKGTGTHIYANALYWHFTREGRQTPVIVFCEGELKAETLCAYGVPAVAIAGISALTGQAKAEAVAMLADLQPANVAMLYDQDATANAGKERRARNFANSQYRFFDFAAQAGTPAKVLIPGDQLAGKGIDDVINTADPSDRADILAALTSDRANDYFEQYSDPRRLYARLMATTARANGYNSSREADQVLHVDSWIGEAQGEITQAIRKHGRVLMQAPTGRGKTTNAFHIAQDWPHRTFIVAPLTLIVRSETETRPDIAVLTDKTNEDQVAAARNARIVMTTADQFWKVKDGMAREDLLIYDEAHYIPANHSWKRSDNIDKLTDAIEHHPHVLAMSATPPPMRYDDWHLLDVRPPAQAVKPELGFLQGTGRVTTAAQVLIERKDKGRAVARLNSEAKLYELKRLLEEDKDLAGHVYVMTGPDKGASHVYKSLAQAGHIPSDCRVLLTTSLADCGLSIRNTDIATIMAIDSDQDAIDAPTFRQFTARVRHQGHKSYILTGARQNAQGVNASHLKQQYRNRAEGHAEARNATRTIAQRRGVHIDIDPETRAATYWSEYEGRYLANPDWIADQVNQAVQSSITPDMLAEDLAQDFLITGTKAAAPEERADIIEDRKARKDRREGERRKARQAIAEHGPAIIDQDAPELDITADDWQREGFKLEASRARKLTEYEAPGNRIGALLETHQAPKPWAALLRRVKFEYVNQHYRAAQLDSADLKDAVEYAQAKDQLAEIARTGAALTTKELAQLLDQHIEGREVSYTQAMRYTETFCTLSEQPREHGAARRYTLAMAPAIVEPALNVVNKGNTNSNAGSMVEHVSEPQTIADGLEPAPF